MVKTVEAERLKLEWIVKIPRRLPHCRWSLKEKSQRPVYHGLQSKEGPTAIEQVVQR
jgi:hypothetical protein